MTGTCAGAVRCGLRGEAMHIPNGPLALFSLILLSTVLTFVLALNEQDSWPAVWRETRRRWLKLMGILAVIALITLAMTLIAGPH